MQGHLSLSAAAPGATRCDVLGPSAMECREAIAVYTPSPFKRRLHHKTETGEQYVTIEGGNFNNLVNRSYTYH